MEIHPKILKAVEQMISDAMICMQYYGEFCQFINFRTWVDKPTCGVNVDLQGMSFYYNEEFVQSLSQECLNFVVVHEIFHLLWDHQSRIRRGGYDMEISNIVQDMIINHIIIKDVIGDIKSREKQIKRKISFIEIPTDKEGNIFVYVKPPEYKGQLIFEEMFEWFIEQKDLYDKWKNDGEKEECPVSDYMKKILDILESGDVKFLDEHLFSDVPEEFKKDIIDNVKRELSARGLLTNNDKLILSKLTKKREDYTKEIKLSTNELFGSSKEKSITKRNRRSIEGLKGKRGESYSLNVLLDTSASMTGYFEKALSYIFQNDIEIELIQVDTEVKKFSKIKNKKQFTDLEIKGLGGTKISSGIKYIIENKKLRKLNLLILTDGFTDVLDFTDYKGKCLILSLGKRCDYKNSNKIKQIIIK